MKETKEEGGGLYRFGVSVGKLMPWVELAKAANIPRRIKRGLEKTARNDGSNPFQWMGSLQPIDISETVIEVMDDTGAWIMVQADSVEVVKGLQGGINNLISLETDINGMRHKGEFPGQQGDPIPIV